MSKVFGDLMLIKSFTLHRIASGFSLSAPPNDRSPDVHSGAGRPAAEKEGQKKHDDEKNEENLRDPRRGTCNSSETE